MPEPQVMQDPRTLLHEIDARQDAVLEQLEQLNVRAERLLKEVLEWRAISDASTGA